MVGKLEPALFPEVFGPHGDEPLDADVVRDKFAALAAEIAAATGHARTPEQVADGFLDIAVENMANAIKHISVQRGYDVTGYTLCCSAAPAASTPAAVADALGMTRVFIHPLAGVLSAYGMGLADVRALRQQAVEARAGRALRWRACAAPFATLERRPRATIARAGHRRRAHRREAHAAPQVRGHRHDARGRRSATLHADASPSSSARYRQQYGFLMPGKPLVIEAIAVEAIGQRTTCRGRAAAFAPRDGAARAARARPGSTRDGAWQRRRRLRPREASAPGRRDRRPGGHSRAQRDDGRSSPAGARR